MTCRVRALLKLLFWHRRRDVEAEPRRRGAVCSIKFRWIRYREQGMREPEARRMAPLRFGHQELVKDQVRDVRAGALLASTARDLRLAVFARCANNAIVRAGHHSDAGPGNRSERDDLLHRQPLPPPPLLRSKGRSRNR